MLRDAARETAQERGGAAPTSLDEDEPPYACGRCGAEHEALENPCPACGAWDALRLVGEPMRPRSRGLATPLDEVEEDATKPRFPTGTAALDKFTGGGIVRGTATIIAGDPGVGKSTLLTRVMADMAASKLVVLLAAAEEQEVEIWRRAKRIDAVVSEVHILETQRIDDVRREVTKLRPDVVVLDSISAMTAGDGEAGSVSEIKLLVKATREMIKTTGGKISVICVAHVNKANQIAGPKQMQYLFDATYYIEAAGPLLVLRSFKDRGAPLASALFEMTPRGVVPVENPSKKFLRDRVPGRPGSMVGATCDAAEQIARPSLFEVQAFVGGTRPGGQRRADAMGFDAKRLAQVLDVLDLALQEARPDLHAIGKLQLASRNVRVNVPGDAMANEPGADLAVALAIASSLLGQPLPPKLVAFGEIGLAGEIRGATRADHRIEEARAMRFETVLAPRNGSGSSKKRGPRVIKVSTLAEAIGVALPAPTFTPSRAPSDPGSSKAPAALGSRKKPAKADTRAKAKGSARTPGTAKAKKARR